MGTNYYLIDKQRCGHWRVNEYHICKKSWGWEPLFQYHNSYDLGEIDSLRKYKELYDTDEYYLVNEYDERFTWEGFLDAIFNTKEPHKKKHKTSSGMYVTYDEDGYEFTSVEFS